MAEDSKKIAPYPIETSFKGKDDTLPGRILKLTSRGLLAEVDNYKFTSREAFRVEFIIPVFRIRFEQDVHAVKVYDRVQKVPGQDRPTGAAQIFEFHFTNLGINHKKAIEDFLIKIGQEEK